uniref:Uncharacterized protein n=1 Tax=Chromulina nebulosa TaxID=96789 RepID=A0A7S0XCE8_9STRA
MGKGGHGHGHGGGFGGGPGGGGPRGPGGRFGGGPGPGPGGFGFGGPGGPGFGPPPPPGLLGWLFAPNWFGWWGPPGPPLLPGERMCWACRGFRAAPPPPPVPFVVDAALAVGATAVIYSATNSNYNSQSIASTISPSAPVDNSNNLRECYVMEYRSGDITMKYFYKIPLDSKVNEIIRVNLNNREFTFKIPDYVRKGEEIILIAPAPLD